MKATKFFLLIIMMFFCNINGVNHTTLSANNKESQTTSFVHSSGKTHSLLLSQEGIVYGFGLWGEMNNPAQQLKIIEPKNIATSIKLAEEDRFISVASGEQHSFLLTKFGRVFGFGTNEHNQLLLNDVSFTSKVVELTDYFNLEANDQIESIACGSNFNVALTRNHQVITFGENTLGQLGIPLDESPYRSHNITSSFLLSEFDYIKKIQCGASYALALSNNGLVYGWGSNEFFQLGTDSVSYFSTPTLIQGLPNNIYSISTGRYTSYALTSDNLLYGWGANNEGQLGSKDVVVTAGNNRATPYLMNQNFSLGNDETIQEIYAGYYYGIIMTNYKNMFGFGQNTSGQLGNKSQITTSYPLAIEYQSLLATQDEIKSISCGQDHVLATTKYGNIFAWGSNLQGQLSASYEDIKQYSSVVDVTNNFPPIVHITSLTSSPISKIYEVQIEAFYLDESPIDSIYYTFATYNDVVPKINWQQYTLNSTLSKSDKDGTYYLWVKVISDKNKEYIECSDQFIVDTTAPIVTIVDENNQIVNEYATTQVRISIEDEHETHLYYTYNGKKYESSVSTITLNKDGYYSIYAEDIAGNKSLSYQFNIDCVKPECIKINDFLLEGNSSFQTRNKVITIEANELLSCYQLGYKGNKKTQLIGINTPSTSFDIKLTKGVNTIVVYDQAGNASSMLEIVYSPTFFNDTQMLFLVFGTLTAIFITLIILTYVYKSKKKLLVLDEDKEESVDKK